MRLPNLEEPLDPKKAGQVTCLGSWPFFVGHGTIPPGASKYPNGLHVRQKMETAIEQAKNNNIFCIK